MRNFLFLLFLVTCFVPTQPLSAQGVDFLHDWEEALAAAQKEDKLIFLDAYTTWCGPCKWMTAKVLPEAEVGKFYNAHFINLKLDMERGDGLKVAELFNVAAYPTLAFVDGDGRMVWRTVGAHNVEEFLALGQKVVDGVEPVQDMYDQYASGEYDRAFLYRYLVHMQDNGMGYRSVLAEYVKDMEGEALHTEEGWDVFRRFFQRTDSEMFQYFEAHRGELGKHHGVKEVNQKYHQMLLAGLSRAMAAEDADAIAQLTAALEPVQDEEVQGQFLNIQLHHIQSTQSLEDAYEALDEWVREGKLLHWSTLNEYAWGVYEKEDAPDLIDRALGWVDLSIERDRNYSNLDTQAMLMYKGGNLDRAIAIAEEAIGLGKEQNEDVSATEAALEKMRAELEGK